MGRKPIISLTALMFGLALAGCYPNNDQYRYGGTRKTQQQAANAFTNRGPANAQQAPVTFPPGAYQPTGGLQPAGGLNNNMRIPGNRQTNTQFTTPHGYQGFPTGGNMSGRVVPSTPVMPPNNQFAPGTAAGYPPPWPGRPVIGQTPTTLPPVAQPGQFNSASPLPYPPPGIPSGQ